MLKFCTLFNSLYLSRGVSLYHSLMRHNPAAVLYVLTMDQKSFDILEKLKFPNLILIKLEDFEDEKLLDIKESRKLGEYCWTCTASLIKYCIDTFKLEYCTYLDADLYFFNDPKILLDEFNDAQGEVLITEHRYTKIYDQTRLSGKYCVQFVTFKNTPKSLTVLNWWRDACVEWCYARFEDGKFGDQKYLDDWPSKFEGIVELQHLGGGVAPWNVQQYSISSENNQVYGADNKDGDKFPVVFYHFHNLSFYENSPPNPGLYSLSNEAKKYLYAPYIKEDNSSRKIIAKVDPEFDSYGALVYNFSIKDIWSKFKYGVKSLWIRN